jgi:hypothetical protein
VVLNDYRNTGAALQYWHDTNGWTSSGTIKRWLTRLRSVVASFNNLMWIVVVWDCASVHLNQDVLTHARRLGILVLFVPAGLTHRLQAMDVYIYAFLKRRVRDHPLFAFNVVQMMAYSAGTVAFSPLGEPCTKRS